MATAVPALRRAGEILGLLAAEPARTWTVSQVAARLALPKATCFATLVCLAELGWVTRVEADKSYCLGPELIRLGACSAARIPGIDLARREMHALARQLDVGCFVCTLVGDEMVILDVANGDDDRFDLPALDSWRVPARPPLGSIYYAWSSAAEIERWLHRTGGDRSERQAEVNRGALRAIRARGYSIGGGVEVQLQVEELLDRIGSSQGDERLELALTLADLVRGTPAGAAVSSGGHPVTHVIAPVFDAGSAIVLTLTLVGAPGQVTDANVARFADPLLAAVGRVTAAIGGRAPV
jgi:DNA-binding IclR family transcriptional regulator